MAKSRVALTRNMSHNHAYSLEKLPPQSRVLQFPAPRMWKCPTQSEGAPAIQRGFSALADLPPVFTCSRRASRARTHARPDSRRRPRTRAGAFASKRARPCPVGSPRRANARQAITDIVTIYHKYRHHCISSHSLSRNPAHRRTCTQAGQEPMESQPRRGAPVPEREWTAVLVSD